MSSRILKESICTSSKIDQLSWFEEVMFYRLIVNADDFGRFDGRLAVLKARLFPLKSTMTDKSIENALNKLETVGLVSTYKVQDKQILQLPAWAKHQTIRNKKSKYPGPEAASFDDEQYQPQESDDIPDQDEPDEPQDGCCESAPSEPPIIEMILKNGEIYPITRQDFEEYAKIYESQNMRIELLKMKKWLSDNSTRRKTKSGMSRFIMAWLERSGCPHVSNGPSVPQPQMTGNPFADEVMS